MKEIGERFVLMRRVKLESEAPETNISHQLNSQAVLDPEALRVEAERWRFSQSLKEVAAFYRKAEGDLIKACGIADAIWSESELCDSAINLSAGSLSAETIHPMRIGYYFIHLKPTGGMRVIVEQVNRLVEAGHDVTVFYRADEGSPLLPDWIQCNPSRVVRIPLESRLHEAIAEAPDEVRELDVIVGTFWTQLWELMQCATTEVVYYEQGHENLYEDPNFKGLQPAFELMIRLPVPIMAVSRTVNQALKKRGREGVLVSPGVSDCFRTGSLRAASATKLEGRPARILLVGSPNLPFKGFDTVIKALAHLKERRHNFEVIWISPTPQPPDLQLPFRCSWVINPPQDVLAAVMRCADVFVSGSYYEAFSLPPLEAMASGLAVVAADSGGIREYARPGENCLLVPPGSPGSMAAAIEKVLTDPEMRLRLISQGKKTADSHRWPDKIRVLEQVLWRLVSIKRNEKKTNGDL
ncbi:MAG TPA: glycosyltransferase family 4 protein [Clostridia bacterium]|nr:glycosyltransferase family 4 protein [Clostridia bacterium]